MKQKLVVFEGIDGCGKTSVIELIKTFLNNARISYYLSYEPGNQFGKMAKFGTSGLTSKDDIYLWWLARRFEQNLFVNKEYNIILKDRYYDSTYVYQNFKDTYLEQHNFDENYFMKPDLTIFLDVNPEIAIKRMINRNKNGNTKKDLYETSNIDILKERIKLFNEIIDKHSNWRDFEIINTNDKTIAEIAATAFTYILRIIDNHSMFIDEENL